MQPPDSEERSVSPIQIVRTVAAALIAGGAALGLVPSGSCGAGWWTPMPDSYASFGWFAYEEISSAMPHVTCGTAMAPVGAWAVALVVMGAVLLAGVWFTTSYTPKQQRRQPEQ